MGIRTEGVKFKQAVDRFLSDLESEMANAIKPIVDQANNDLQANLFASVYGTAPGTVYIRTGNLKSFGNTNASDLSKDGKYIIKLSSSADYASDIEYGSGTSQIDPGLLQQISEASGGNNISFGRSGINYMLPGPFVMPATVKSRIILEATFIKLLGRWK